MLNLATACQTIHGAAPLAINQDLTDENWRNTRPAIGPERPGKLPKIEQIKLQNGLTLLVSTDKTLPVVDIKLVALAGSSRDPVGKAGLSELCFNMLDEGAGTLDALGMTQAFADIGTSLLLAVGQDAGALGVPVLKPYVERGIELLSLMVQKPHLLAADFERVQSLQLASLAGRQGNPSVLAVETFYETAYGKNHAYGHTMSGNIKSVKNISALDVKKFFTSYFAPTNTAIVIAGDLELGEAKALVEKYFSDWKHTPVATPKIASPTPKSTTSIELISRPSSPQTFIMLGRPYLAAKNPDEYKLKVFNEILGGMFTSRLNMNLREDKSWTYGAKSSFDTLIGLGPFVVATSIQVPYAADALGEIFKEFARMRDTDVSDNELNMAKNGLLNSFVGKFETVSNTSTQMAYLYIYGLGLDYFDRWQKNIATVTSADVQAMAKQVLAPNRFSIVAVGDLDAMKKQIEALKLGTVRVKVK